MNQSQPPIWHQPGEITLNSITDPGSMAASLISATSQQQQQLQQSSPFNKTINIETESILSSYSSDRSKKHQQIPNRNGTAAYATVLNNTASNLSLMTAQSPLTTNNILNPYHGNYQGNNNSGQVQSVVSMRSRNSHHSIANPRPNGQVPKTLESPYSLAASHNPRQDVVQVSMIPPDDNWNDNTTAITGNTSDQSGSLDDLTKIDKPNTLPTNENQLPLPCQMWSSTVIASILSACAFISPIIMVILPQVDWLEWKTKECGPECDGLIISFVFKLFILAVCSWAVFFRRPKATLPRICVYRAAILALIVIFMVAYWLFYSVRIAEKRFSEEDAISYYSIILFAISLVDALLFIHYIAVLLLRFRHQDTQYFIKVVRSPDGFSRCYSLGRTSIQRASVWILEKYYEDFPRYNPFLEKISLKKFRKNSNSSNRHGLKYYDVDGVIGSPNNKPDNNNENNSTLNSITLNPLQLSPKSILAQNTAANSGRPKGAYLNGGSTISDGRGNRRNNSNIDRDTTSHHSGHSGHHHHRHHSDRIHEEHDYERRVRKRKSRLISVTEEAFAHIKRVQQTRNGPSVPMDSKEAAQAIFPTIAKSLQKFLRITRQQTRHSVQSILEHLAICLTHDLSPKTFLEKYFAHIPVLVGEDAQKPIQTWSLICDTLVSRSIKSGTMFLLRQGDVSLLVTIQQMPHFNLIEEVVDSENTKFIFKLNSETSV